MDKLTKEIDDLFDTWLGTWKASRRFLAVLRTISYELEAINDRHSEYKEIMEREIRDLRTANEEMRLILDQKPQAPQTVRDGYNSAGKIMDSFYDAVNGGDNK